MLKYLKKCIDTESFLTPVSMSYWKVLNQDMLEARLFIFGIRIASWNVQKVK